MIAHLNGRLLSKSPQSAIVDAAGVGYEVFIPLSTYSTLPPSGETVAFKVFTLIKDDGIRLYGFSTQEEKDAFTLLITVSGVGPKLAINMLSGLKVEELLRCIAGEDSLTLKGLSGVGKKTAERVIVELKDKIKSSVSFHGAEGKSGVKDALINDVVSALVNLGYKSQDAEAAAVKCKEHHGKKTFEELFKAALKMLSKR